ncbi:MAG TPA: hypothetical protein VEQ63_13700 [Bryobacteraceae bacterium]|nr:hypothetical protein [Bryobacteraceae bacterium]
MRVDQVHFSRVRYKNGQLLRLSSPPPVVASGRVHVRVMSTGGERKTSLLRRDEFGDRYAIPGDNHFLTFHDLVEELRKVRFGVMDIEGSHDSKLFHYMDYVNVPV